MMRTAMYAPALDMVCVDDTLWRSSLLQDRLVLLGPAASPEPLRDTLFRLVCLAVACHTEAEAVSVRADHPRLVGAQGAVEVPPATLVLEASSVFFSSLPPHERRPLHVCLTRLLVLERDDSSSLALVLLLLAKGSLECPARRSAIFSSLINRIPLKKIAKKGEKSDDDALMACIRDFVDGHKENAFKAVFLEPTKAYFRICNNRVMEGDVDVHGANTYQALLECATGRSTVNALFFIFYFFIFFIFL